VQCEPLAGWGRQILAGTSWRALPGGGRPVSAGTGNQAPPYASSHSHPCLKQRGI